MTDDADYTRCWACGLDGSLYAVGQALLCGPCRHDVVSGPRPAPRVGTWHPMEWYQDHCWHCGEAPVGPPAEDGLGLCPACVGAMIEMMAA